MKNYLRYALVCGIFVLVMILLFSSASAKGAVRTLPSTYSPGNSIVVNLSVTFDSSDCGGAIVEYLPSGWSASRISGGGNGYYNPSLNTITWAPIDGVRCGGSSNSYVLGYFSLPNTLQSGNKTFSGVFGVDGTSYEVTGDKVIEIQQDSGSSEEEGSEGSSGGNGGDTGGSFIGDSSSQPGPSSEQPAESPEFFSDEEDIQEQQSEGKFGEGAKYFIIVLIALLVIGIIYVSYSVIRLLKVNS